MERAFKMTSDTPTNAGKDVMSNVASDTQTT